MAHQSHAPDTTFIVSEPDFVFYKEDGDAYLSYLSKEEAETQTLTRWEEMAEKLSPEAAKDFRRELRAYLEAVKKDKNAPWPKERPQPLSDEDELAKRRWTSELVDTETEWWRRFRGRRSPPHRDSGQRTSAITSKTCRR